MSDAYTSELSVVCMIDGRRQLERRLVTLGPAAIHVGDSMIPRDAIASVSFQPRVGRHQTVLCSNREGAPLLEVVLEHVVDAHVLLVALGRTPAECRREWAVGGPLGATGLRTLVCLLAAIASATTTGTLAAGSSLGFSATIFLSFLALIATLAVLFWPARVVVGADGILWRWYGARRFVPWKDVLSPGPSAAGYNDVIVEMRSGSPLRLPQGAAASRIDQDTLRARVDALYRAHAKHGNDVVIDWLVRNARPLASWREALGRLRGNEGYREMGMSDESLWRIVEDAGAPEDARAGAAIALRDARDAAPRLRVAAQAVASPHLRVALEAAADPAVEEAALDEALARVAD